MNNFTAARQANRITHFQPEATVLAAGIWSTVATTLHSADTLLVEGTTAAPEQMAALTSNNRSIGRSKGITEIVLLQMKRASEKTHKDVPAPLADPAL